MNEDVSGISIGENNEVVREGFAFLVSSVSHHLVVSTYSNCGDAIKSLNTDSPLRPGKQKY